jgi:hypothetical protein
MFSPSDTFDHDLHADRMGGNDACILCHRDPAEVKSRETATPCLECHRDMAAQGSFVPTGSRPVLESAAGFMDAMHGLCIECHKTFEEREPESYSGISRCEACHREMDPEKVENLKPHAAHAAKAAKAAEDK